MKTKILLAILALTLVGCSDPDKATKALKGAGYTNIHITGYSWFSCSQDDTFSTGFVATGPTGERVVGTVCSGLFMKGSTIRTH